MGEIQFDVISAGQTMRQISDIRKRLDEETISGFEECMSRMSDAWEGEAAIRFHAAAGRELEKLRQTERLLERARLSLTDAIRKAQRTEEKVKEIAETRIY